MDAEERVDALWPPLTVDNSLLAATPGAEVIVGLSKKKPEKVPDAVYEAELLGLQAELVKLQEWTRATGPGSW